jgi:hypothetical protein
VYHELTVWSPGIIMDKQARDVAVWRLDEPVVASREGPARDERTRRLGLLE